MTEKIAYILLASALAWGWGCHQYNKGWNDCHGRLMDLLRNIHEASEAVAQNDTE